MIPLRDANPTRRQPYVTLGLILASFVVTKQSVAPGTQVPVDTAVTVTARTSSNGKG